MKFILYSTKEGMVQFHYDCYDMTLPSLNAFLLSCLLLCPNFYIQKLFRLAFVIFQDLSAGFHSVSMMLLSDCSCLLNCAPTRFHNRTCGWNNQYSCTICLDLCEVLTYRCECRFENGKKVLCRETSYGEMSTELSDTQVDPALWEISGYMQCWKRNKEGL
ncbi:unnamed protein product [Trifolium pratense]|uniref:Uncharacterized protein n=1 Tax=Trifolium pratense TaxID=57577 RepID=A0ACB0M3U3_TRIPR|nr:unnamed protein product [Trifolium pratense]